MNKQLLSRAVLVCAVSLGLTGSALAQCSQHKASSDDATAKSSTGAPTCSAHQVADKGSKDAGCCAKVLSAAGAPAMQYKVGDKTTYCPQEAAKLAAASDDAKIVFVVGEKDYADKTEALKAYASALDEHLAKLTELRYVVGDATVTCPIAAAAMAASGREVKYRLASFTFDDKSTAQQAATTAREAADKVQMKMVVDGKEVACCEKSAQKTGDGKSCCASKNAGMAKTSGESHQCSANKDAGMAKASGENHQCSANMKEASAKEKREYVVGDLKTPCEQTARVQLAQAKIVAAYNALEEIASKPENSKAVAANE